MRKTTSFWSSDETSRTRSIAAKLAVRSVPPSGMVSSLDLLSTSSWFGDGSPMMTFGGSAMTTTLITSPRRASLTSCAARSLACSNRVPSPPRTHAQRAVQDEDPMRPLPGQDRQRPEALQERLGHRRDHQDMTIVRTASSSHCSTRIRREFLRIAASRNLIAAHGISRNFRRFSRWMMIGTDAAARPYISGSWRAQGQDGRSATSTPRYG